MLYLHTLPMFSLKTVELESVPIIREIKEQTPYPLNGEKLSNYFGSYFVSQLDLEHIQEALTQIEPALNTLKRILLERDQVHEPANLQRSIQLLNEVPEALSRNLAYAEEMIAWQEQISTVASLLNQIPLFKTKEEKIAGNKQIQEVFETLLRHKDFTFKFQDIINEMHLNHINDLAESLEQGYLFHFTLEEELRKDNFAVIQSRIPPERLAEAASIQQSVESIKKAVSRAYNLNLSMACIATFVYSYVKWLNSKV